MQRAPRLPSPLSVSPTSAGGAASSRAARARALLQRPRVLASLLLLLLLAATLLSFGLLSAHDDDGWTATEPYALVGGGDEPADPRHARPDKPFLRRPLESNGTDGALVPMGRDASPDAMSVYARCHNSKQGRKLVTDDAGAICARQHVLLNGCCRSTKALATRSCAMCRTDVQCCRSYEYCVSCCLSSLPAEDRADDSVAGSAAALAGAPPRFSFHSFDRCLHLCRTSSRSIKHGNVYKTAVLKHCYTEGEHALPVQFDEQSARVIVAQQGVSCTRTCNAYKDDGVAQIAPPSSAAADDVEELHPLPPPASPALFICHEAFLPLINQCDTLRKHFACAKDACQTNAGNDQPALALAPLRSQGSGAGGLDGELTAEMDAQGRLKGECLLNGDPKLFDCEGHHESTRRLCVCIHADKAE